MIILKPQGRTGNLLLQNIGISILSKKFNLKVSNYSFIPNLETLGVTFNNSGRIINNLVEVYDNIEHLNHLRDDHGKNIDNSITLIDILDKNEVDSGLFVDCTFQVKDFVIKYRNEILQHFKLNYVHRNSQLFVHVRLGDVEFVNPGLNYYRQAISSVDFSVGYISSDTFSHPIVQTLIKEFNLIPYTEQDPVNILNFSKNFENLVLSKGTFSWWIAFLSKSKKIIFPENDTKWYGDIFVFSDWEFIKI